jgi:hypothetical protein
MKSSTRLKRTSFGVLDAGTCGTSPKGRKDRRVRRYSGRGSWRRRRSSTCSAYPLRPTPSFSSTHIRSRLILFAGDFVGPFAHRWSCASVTVCFTAGSRTSISNFDATPEVSPTHRFWNALTPSTTASNMAACRSARPESSPYPCHAAWRASDTRLQFLAVCTVSNILHDEGGFQGTGED